MLSTKNILLIVLFGLLMVYGVSFVGEIKENQAMLTIGDKEIAIGECLIREATGNKCPTCGMTRSFISMSHLDFNRAYTYNHGGPVIYIAGIAFMVATVLLWRGKERQFKVVLMMTFILIGIGVLFFLQQWLWLTLGLTDR